MSAGKFELDLPPQELCLPEIREIVLEASRALALLDAARLEEMALSCQRLNRNLASIGPPERADRARQARQAVGDMAVFARVLEATRANLDVMHRLRDLREGRLEYACPQRILPERIHGDD